MRILNTQAELIPTKGAERPITLMAVLTCGNDVHVEGDCAVYVGAVDLGDYESDPTAYGVAKDVAAEWIAHNGSAQPYREALHYFSGLNKADYRR